MNTAARQLAWTLLGAPALRLSYHNLYAFRRWLLHRFGATLGDRCRIRSTATIDRPWLVTIGERAIVGDHAHLRGSSSIHIGDRTTISQMVVLCTDELTHDGTSTTTPIHVGHDCWVAADTHVRPGAHIADGTLVGARSLVEGELPPWTIAAGEPALPRRPRHLAGRSPEHPPAPVHPAATP
ncbi:MAG: colanic acid biosynthesis acetyltransferase WcaF [Planctomycetota bacterium]